MSQPPLPPPVPAEVVAAPVATPSSVPLAERVPRRLKRLRPDQIAALVQRDPRLIIPVGTCEQHGPHMPIGSDTLIVERFAEALSAEFSVLLAPTIEYGVNVMTERGFAGNASVRKKTLHRTLNDCDLAIC